MDTHPTDHFARIAELAGATFEIVIVETDVTPERIILRLEAVYGLYRIFVTELIDMHMRKYSYYVLHGNMVEAGFDNSPDPRALRLKYGKIGVEHAGEYIPHLHRANKTQLTLTEDVTFEGFVDWLKNHLGTNR